MDNMFYKRKKAYLIVGINRLHSDALLQTYLATTIKWQQPHSKSYIRCYFPVETHTKDVLLTSFKGPL